MKLICPRCSARSIVPDERVPAKGAWAKCPKCRERFFIKLETTARMALARPPDDAAFGAPAGRRPQSAEDQKIIDRIKGGKGGAAEYGAPPPGSDLELVTVFPEPVYGYRFYFFLPVLAGLVALAAVALLFKKSSDISPVPDRAVLEEFRVTDYGPEQLRANLAYLRKSTRRRNYVSRSITTSGPEIKVFENLLERLAPGGCGQGIDSLDLKSSSPSSGFEAQVFCRPKGLHQFKISVRWQNGFAVVAMPGRSASLAIPLTPEAAAGPAPGELPADGLKPVTSIVEGQVVELFVPVSSTPAPDEEPEPDQGEESEPEAVPAAPLDSGDGRDPTSFESYDDFLSRQ